MRLILLGLVLSLNAHAWNNYVPGMENYQAYQQQQVDNAQAMYQQQMAEQQLQLQQRMYDQQEAMMREQRQQYQSQSNSGCGPLGCY